MRKHIKQVLSGFLTGAIITILAITILPKVLSNDSAEMRETVVTVEHEEEKPQKAVQKTATSISTSTHTHRRERCISGNCLNERNESSRYCDLHDNGYRPRRSYSTGSELTRDVDDLDVEGFYLENRDEFEDEDDAWDYLEDNEDEWDDY